MLLLQVLSSEMDQDSGNGLIAVKFCTKIAVVITTPFKRLLSAIIQITTSQNVYSWYWRQSRCYYLGCKSQFKKPARAVERRKRLQVPRIRLRSENTAIRVSGSMSLRKPSPFRERGSGGQTPTEARPHTGEGQVTGQYRYFLLQGEGMRGSGRYVRILFFTHSRSRIRTQGHLFGRLNFVWGS